MTSPPSIENLFRDYTPPEPAFDEFAVKKGHVRPHWRHFVTAINRLGPQEFARRWAQARDMVRENGIAFVGHLATDKPRPWELDATPWLTQANEWAHVSEALKQRATLLNLALRDLYGKQSLLTSGVLPPETVFLHPEFSRAYHGQALPDDRYLHFYSADLARAADGKWWVLADRAEAPSGMGFALENRVVLSRMLPELFRDSHVQRLAPFFIAAQQALANLSQNNSGNPRVVMLSSGPENPNYFEDAYLARYLGYTLVEGGDLSVRNRRVMLKTLGGLLPVDVVLRRQNSSQCDPLMLDAKSSRGVAGLLQAAKAGNVSVANALGSGLVESPVFLAFMPRICQALMGEDLMMPGVATWWCGEKASFDYVLKHLDSLTVLRAYRERGQNVARRESLSQLPADKLEQLIRAEPTQYVAQERVVRSSVPVWNPTMRPRYLAIRAYAVSSGDSYMVMPGALARTSTAMDPLEISLSKGEGSKDAWVCSDHPVEDITLLGEVDSPVALRRGGAELPSRSADNLFWLGRQLERAEAAARLYRSVASRMSGETRLTSGIEIPVLLRCLAEQGQIEPGYVVDSIKKGLPTVEEMLPAAAFASDNAESLRAVIDELYRLAALVRDRMSQDTWRIVHRIDEQFRLPANQKIELSDLIVVMNNLITELAALGGAVIESMTRTHAFRFLELGRRLERSWQIIGLLKSVFLPLPERHGPILETVLEVADSLITYRSRYLANLQLLPVLDLVITDETNPRSLAFQFARLSEYIDQLPRDQTLPGYTGEQRIVMSLLHSVRTLDVQSIAEQLLLGEEEDLTDQLDQWESLLPKLSEAICHRYLVHADSSYQLATIQPQ